MRLLLDTHTFLWFVLNDSRLSDAAAEHIIDPASDVFVSPASYWEIAIKVGLGKLALHVPYGEFMRRGIVDNQFGVLPIDWHHAAELTTMPLHHRDPFDRLIVAQAMVEAMPVISADAALDLYPVRRIW